ncbi:MAG TPA: PSD1 and planctomycete cytochrome C domain-containing protein, partial [Bryobacteraceae bacterium]
MKGKALQAAVILVTLAAARAEVLFNRDIRPIMAETCFRCHGPDKSSRQAGMRLDIREEALKPTQRGSVPIVPGDPDKSAIIQRIFSAGARVMPPAYIHKELTPAQKNTVRQWVSEGAKYEGHWAYQPVRRLAPEAAGNPIDGFIQERLARAGLHPSPEADRRTLIRRVTLDLTGLPPTPEDVAAFLKDSSPDAYEKLVDRLLATPQYAEQQTMHWLDAVRYADTCGFHGDNAFPAWPYRDYVLHSFRDNKPFDEFTREQLAGDLIPNATKEQRTASAYNRLNRTSAEGGLQPKEYLAKYGADRVRTTVAVWMGSTLGCAECHDHKFDPFTSRDFYSMKAFFADIKETGLVPDRGSKAWGSLLPLPTPDQQKRQEALQQQIADAHARLTAKMETLASKRADWEKQLLARYDAGELAWKFQRPSSAKSENGATLKIYNDGDIDYTIYDGASLATGREPANGLVVASGPNPDNETYTVTFQPGAGTWKALGIQFVQDEGLPGLRVARGADRLVLTEVEAEVDGRKPTFSVGTSNLNATAPEHPPAAAFDGDPKTGWAVATYNENSKLVLALRFAEPLSTSAGSVMTVRLHHDSDFRRAVTGRFRLMLSSGDYSWPTADKGKEIPDAVLKALRVEEDKRTPQQKAAVEAHFQWASPEALPEVIEVAKLEKEAALLDTSIARVMVAEATEPTETRILARGNWMDESGDVVQPAIPAFLGKLQTGDRRATRLDLANWLVSPENPLTARVFANRTWREFFGIGLSKSLDDLGSQGEWPTHPELLDWLAAEFMKPEWQAEATHAWDVRHLIRTIVTSRTYRQSSLSTTESEERDPDNRLLSRQNRFRVDAEVVRDVALSVSGLLVEEFGGPSAKPYEPDGYLAAMNFPRREYSASHGQELYRRGVYTFWQRSFLHPSLLTFDAPTREECTVNRINSNTPLQALVLLNDPIYVEAARVFAQNILKQGHTLNDRLDWAFLRALDRQPTAAERHILADLYGKSLVEFRHSPTDAESLIHEGEAPVPSALKPSEF